MPRCAPAGLVKEGEASAAMTMGLYGRLIDHNLWEATRKVGGTTGAHDGEDETEETPEPDGPGA